MLRFFSFNTTRNQQPINQQPENQQSGNQQPISEPSESDYDSEEESSLSSHNKIALTALDIRNQYKFDRAMDRSNALRRFKSAIEKEIGTPSSILRNTVVSSVLAKIPGGDTGTQLYDVVKCIKNIHDIKGKAQQYTEDMQPIFDNQLTQEKNSLLMKSLGAVDITPYGVLSTGVKTARSLKSIKEGVSDSSRSLRMEIATLQKTIDQPKPASAEYRQWHARQLDLLDERNESIYELVSTDTDAGKSFVDLAENSKRFHNGNLQSELRHHTQVIRAHDNASRVSEKNNVDTSANLRPNIVRQQVLSEGAMKLLFTA